VQDIDRNRGSLGSLRDFGDISTDGDTKSLSEHDVNDDFENDIATLRDYFLTVNGEDTMVFSLHRLVQLMVRMWLKKPGLNEEWKERFISNLIKS